MPETNPDPESPDFPRPAPKRVPLAESLPEQDVPAAPIRRPARTAQTPGGRADAEDLTRRLTLASIQFRRGQTQQAKQELDTLLAFYPQSAQAYELQGDLLASEGNAAGAQEAYEAALRCEPGRVTAESKMARLTLRKTEETRRAELGVAYAGAETPSFAAANPDSGRNLMKAVIASAIFPGLGQIVQGEFIKGLIIVGATIIVSLVWFTLPDFRAVLRLLSHPQVIPSNLGTGFGTMACGTIGTVLWLYSLVDLFWKRRAPSR